MKIINRNRAGIIHTRHGSEIRPLIDRTTADIERCSLAEETLPPGHRVTPHHHDETEEIYYILAGRGVMTVGGQQREVGPGDAVFIPRRHRHSLANTGDQPMTILLICGPAFSREDEIFAPAPDSIPPAGSGA